MTLFEQIQLDRKYAMKVGNKIKCNLLGVVLADATKIDKVPSDDQVVKTVKNTVTALQESQAVKHSEAIATEIYILSEYLPKLIDEDTLRAFIKDCWEVRGGKDSKQFGSVMQTIKNQFGSKVDMSLAAKIVKEN